MYIKVQGQAFLINVGIADNLSLLVVLGLDLPVLFALLDFNHKFNLAVTKAHAKKNWTYPLKQLVPCLSLM